MPYEGTSGSRVDGMVGAGMTKKINGVDGEHATT